MQEHLLISKATVDRLPRYYRCLRQLTDEGVEIASSEELGRRLAINPEQIRKDLAFFGQFGKKGVGYYVAELKASIGTILGLDHHWNVARCGGGSRDLELRAREAESTAEHPVCQRRSVRRTQCTLVLSDAYERRGRGVIRQKFK